MDRSVGEIAELVGGEVDGDATVRITGVNGIREAKTGDITFVGSSHYANYLDTTSASAVFVGPKVGVRGGAVLIRVPDPFRAFVQVLQQCQADAGPVHPSGIHETAVLGQDVELGDGVCVGAHACVGDGAVLGDGVVLYPGVYVGRGCNIGSGTVVYPNAVIREGVEVGARCILHSGVILGSDGFGFAPVNGTLFKVPQVGRVLIGDDVEIGSNSAVDRATFGHTVVGTGTKIDNLVQIGHNVEVGRHCVISGMTGVAGSTRIGDGVTVAAQVGIADHMEIGDGATIAGRAGVVTRVKAGETVSGFPAIDHKADMRILASLRRLPDLAHRLRELEQRVCELEEQLHGKADHNR